MRSRAYALQAPPLTDWKYAYSSLFIRWCSEFLQWLLRGKNTIQLPAFKLSFAQLALKVLGLANSYQNRIILCCFCGCFIVFLLSLSSWMISYHNTDRSFSQWFCLRWKVFSKKTKDIWQRRPDEYLAPC